jgi:hypothetical protein
MLYSKSEEFEGISMTHLDGYIVIVGGAAGANGGSAIYDCETAKWVFSCRDCVINKML